MLRGIMVCQCVATLYRGADKSLARPEREQAYVSVRTAWISSSALPCKEKKTLWQLASRCSWNRARPWHASELVSFLVDLRIYQHPGMYFYRFYNFLYNSNVSTLWHNLIPCAIIVVFYNLLPDEGTSWSETCRRFLVKWIYNNSACSWFLTAIITI